MIRLRALSVLSSAACCGLPALAASCESLAALAIPSTAIRSAVLVSAGPSSAGRGAGQGGQLPAYCRVGAVATPVAGSEIHIEVWLPEAAVWNGKLLGTGNGGYSGALGFADMERGLRQGYAVAGSDTGHAGGDLKFGLRQPEKIDDWAWRAVHVMTETPKLVVRSYYGRLPRHSYFAGCSTGGQQALTEAQRFPADYDGIAAGAPGNNRVRLNVGFLWSWLAANQGGAASLPSAKLGLIHQAAVRACDASDGLKDGLISDPRSCTFDPATLACKAGDAADCLTPPQAAAVGAIYDGAKNPRTGERLYPGWVRGSETGWNAYFVGQPEPARLDFWRYWVFDDPNWDFRSFDFDRDVAFADNRMEFLTANDPDLTRFRAGGGRLLLYQGLADPVVPPDDTIRYFETVERGMGGLESTSRSVRLFLAPGMGHCAGGEGPGSFDPLPVLDRWVAGGETPERIIATHTVNGTVDRSRPLCPYPQIARWKGSGSIDDASSFECAVAGR